jgi:hypothetical protein
MNEHESRMLKPWLDPRKAWVRCRPLLKARLLPWMPTEPVHCGSSHGSGTARDPLRHRQRALLPIAALLATLAINPWQIDDAGDIDAQLLSQELPPDAFLDQDFRSWLAKPHG